MLQGGANDLGGTLMEETISRMAGSEHGSEKTVAELRAIAEGIGRPRGNAVRRTRRSPPETVCASVLPLAGEGVHPACGRRANQANREFMPHPRGLSV